MGDVPFPRDPWSAGNEFRDSGDGLVRFENPRAELVAVRRELLARLVTVLSRRLHSSTRAVQRVPPPHRFDRPANSIAKPRDPYAGGSNSARFDISTAGPRFTHWRASLVGLALIVLGLVVPSPLTKFGLCTGGAVLLVHAVIRSLQGK